MLTKTLAATAALSMLVGGGSALAQSKSSTMAGPKQPIPYSQLNAYMKASPKARASKDWWAGSPSAATGSLRHVKEWEKATRGKADEDKMDAGREKG